MTDQVVFNQITVLKLTGKDALNFLNNQAISEFNELTHVQYSAICNPKGRIIFTFILLKSDQGFYLAINHDLSERLIEYIKFRKFRMDLSLIKTDLYLAIKNDQSLDDISVTTQTPDHKEPLSNEFWQFIFKLNLPWITQQTTELFIPQHVNLDQEQIIAFDKGCYPGQEIIARLHYIGKVKKRMHLITLNHNENYQAGDKVYLNELSNQVEFCSPLINKGSQWIGQCIY